MSWADISSALTVATFAALGNDVTIGATTGKGILKSPSESILDGILIVTDYLLELPVATWASVAEGTAITVDGVGYVSRETSRLNPDGSSIMVPLELA